MGYVPGFKYDVFISYAHPDNEPDPQDFRWVSALAKHLRILLKQRLGVDLDVFFDSADIRSNEYVGRLHEAIRNSAIFVPVVSPGYVAQPATLQELGAFTRSAGSAERIALIEILPVDRQSYPPQIRNLKTTPFYRLDPHTSAPLRLAPDSDRHAYIERLEIFAHGLIKLLRELQAPHALASPPAPPADHPHEETPAPQAGKAPFDVFISYPIQDKTTADAACAALENAGIRCWIAPRDVPVGHEWAGAIIDAIDHCRAMVLIFSTSANESKQIRREVQRAFDREIPVIPMRIENILPTKSLAYFMGPVHWLDAMTPPLEKHLQQLTKSVRGFVQAA
jgi:TIR domain